MIELSPLDVRKKKDDFRRSLRGYDAGQVDTFLDLVADRLEELVSERRQLAEKVAAMEEQLSDFRERERALNEALLAAQELREEARTQAEKDAELRIQEAEARAQEIVGEAQEEVRELERELERLKKRKATLLRSLRGTLERFGDELEVEEARLDGAPAPGSGAGATSSTEGGEASEADGGGGPEAAAGRSADGRAETEAGAAGRPDEDELSLLPDEAPTTARSEPDARPFGEGPGDPRGPERGEDA